MRNTRHGSKRIRERVGVNKKVVDKLAQKALEEGISHKDTVGSLKKYISSLYLKYRVANNIKVYNRKLYLFKFDKLITVLNLPHIYHKIEDKLKKKLK